MRLRIPVFGLLLFMILAASVNGDQPSEIYRLIQQLGSPQFKERQAASKRLEAIGEPAWEALHKAAASSQDPEVRQRAAQLARAVGHLHSLAGRYYLGNGNMRFLLQLEEEGRFRFAWAGCPGFNEHSQGRARKVGGWLVLLPENRKVPKGFEATPTEFLPLTWRTRMYLLAKDELLDFCNAVNQGVEPRTEPDGLFCLREGDWTESVHGLPTLPEEWSGYLLHEPLRGAVSEMTDERTGRLNLGEKDGVRKGMVLAAGQSGKQPYTVRVISVKQTSCLVREEFELIVPTLKKGHEVSSRMSPEQLHPRRFLTVPE